MHRSTEPVDRSQPRVGSLQSVDRPVNRSHPAVDRTGRPLMPCACCARRSTGPVDRTPATAGGRPGRSTELLLLLLLTCFAAVLRRVLPSSTFSTILVDFLDDILSFLIVTMVLEFVEGWLERFQTHFRYGTCSCSDYW